MKRDIYQKQVCKALEMYERAGIVLTEEEKKKIEVVDLGMGMVDKLGLQILTYINTDRVCAKEMVMLPNQCFAEHKHVPTNGMEGKEETFRCRYGRVYLYVSGEGKREDVSIDLPDTELTVFHEVVLEAGEQYTIMPETLHWFGAGEEGAVISEFSTKSTDETDVFTDKRLVREVIIED